MKEFCNCLLFSTQDRSEDCQERVETLCLKQSYFSVKALTKYWLVDNLRVNTLQRLYESSIVLYKEFLHSTPHPSEGHGLRAVVQAGSIYHIHKWNFHHLLCVSKTLLISLYILSQ